MRLKYYMRGLGVGIIVTAILMGIATDKQQKMTDEEIKARAAELGMIEQQTTLADIRDDVETTAAPDMTEAPTTVPTLESSVTEAPTETPVTETTPEPTEESTPEQTVKPTSEPTEAPIASPEVTGEIVVIQINPGDYSEKVSKVLEETGLIENASAFNKYLKKNKLDNIIDVGTYEIPMGTPEEEIARIITD